MTTSIEQEVLAIVRLQLGVTAVAVAADLQAELGADSFDLVNIAAAMEERLGLDIAEEQLARVVTVADLVDLASAPS